MVSLQVREKALLGLGAAMRRPLAAALRALGIPCAEEQQTLCTPGLVRRPLPHISTAIWRSFTFGRPFPMS